MDDKAINNEQAQVMAEARELIMRDSKTGPITSEVPDGWTVPPGGGVTKSIASLWCEFNDENETLNFSLALSLALQEYAGLIQQGRAGQLAAAEIFVASNGVRLTIATAIWRGVTAPYQPGKA